MTTHGTDIEIEKGIYDINRFQIRFFTEKEIRDLTTAASEGFEIIWIKEEYEEPYYRRERNNMSSEVLSSNVIPFAGSGLAVYIALRDISNKLGRMLYQKASQDRSNEYHL